MIPAVTAADNTVSQSTTKPVKNRPLATGMKQYTDSFVRNTVESTPIMLAFTGGWALFDKFAMKTTFKKALSHNFKNFFGKFNQSSAEFVFKYSKIDGKCYTAK